MCGIFGIIAKKPRKFDYTTFCTLGIHNDLRGGDSCGVFIDGKVEYGTNKKKLFEDFFGDSKVIQNTKESTIAFGHCRKASIGVVNEQNAQPVIIYNDKNEIEFVVIHNGTIYNYKELAKKYIPEVDIKDMTDSQVMTRIFYYKGYDVLKEYNGGAVFAIADYRSGSPEIYFWQGASKSSYDGKVEDERPLYFAISKDHITFSSIYTFLPVLERDSTIVVLTPNWLYKYEDDDIVSKEEYDRSTQCQYNVGSRNNNYYDNFYNNNNYYNNSYYNNNGFHYSTGEQNSNYSFGSLFGSTKNGQCFLNGKPAHGMVKATAYGSVCVTYGQLYEIWFWNGIMLKNKDCFDYLCTISREFGVTPSELYDVYTELVLYLSPYPFFRTNTGEVEVVDGPISSTLYTGELHFPFTSMRYNIDNGKTKSSITATQFEAMKAFFEHRDDKLPMPELIKNFGDFE